jgi:hypothetical protein
MGSRLGGLAFVAFCACVERLTALAQHPKRCGL